MVQAPEKLPQTTPETLAARNLKAASELLDFAYQVKFHQLRLKHPEHSDEQICKEVLLQIEKASR